MKSVLFASVAAIALTAGLVSAQAADMQRAPIVKAPAYVAPVFSWTGPYIGVSGGYGWGTGDDFRGGTNPGGASHDGWLLGGTIGYNWQMGPTIVGVEGDISWTNFDGGGVCAGPAACSINNDWLGTARARLGYNGGRFMPYITGGAAFGNIDARIAGAGSDNSTKLGWTVGGGIEAAISGPWTAKLEYLYVDLGRGDSIGATGTSAEFKTNIVRAGLNYKF